MPQQPNTSSPNRPTIPHVTCPRCKTEMRLAIIEPAAMADAGVDTLVFECTCGFAFKQPVAKP